MICKVISATVLSFLSSVALAGSWSSGGTELLADTRNPWFLSNTLTATYCVLIDDQSAGISKAEATAVIARALAFWKREFAFAVLPTFPDFGRLKIADQHWAEHTCAGPNDEGVDLRFQFGVLTTEQEVFIRTPPTFAAISVRTDYDKRQLKGKGFIYVSPVSGRLAYQGAPGQTDLWSRNDGENLYPILLHELGHVFGLPHMGALGQLMSEGFAETFLGTPPVSFEQFFGLAPRREFCPLPELLTILKRFFGMLDPVRSCLRLEYGHDATSPLFGNTEMQVYAVANGRDSGQLLGKASLRLSGFFVNFASLIWLSSEQNVFSEADLARWGTPKDRIPGINTMRIAKKGLLRGEDGRPDRSLSISFQQGNPMISGSGVLDGDILDSFF